MGTYETGIRTAWRSMMHVAEARIEHAGMLGQPLARGAARDAAPVLLVPGYGNSWKSMGAIERSLNRDGFDAITVDLPIHGFGDAMSDARYVADAAAEFRVATGKPVVDIVGHSRGGLVSRAAKQLLDEQGGIGRVVTLGSANQGLDLGIADRAIGSALPAGMQQIRRGSTLIAALHDTRGTADLVAVGTNGFDGILAPASSARIEGAPFSPVDVGRTTGPMSHVGHYGVLRDDASYEAIRGALLAARE